MGSLAAIAGPILSIGGGLISGSKASNAQNAAAQTAREDAARSARMAQFTPVGVSTRFGTSNFGFDDFGRLNSAGYNLSPELRALQDYAVSQANAGQADTSRLLSLGRGYLAESPEESAQNYYNQQRQLIAPGEERTLGGIKSGLLRTGRGGLSVGQGGALAASNPELQAYYNALAQRDLELASAAEQEGRNRIAYGQGLLSSAYTPISTPVGLAGTFENLGRESLDIGAALGGQSAAAGGRAADLYAGGMATANQLQLARNSYSPLGTALSGAGSALGGMGGGSGLGSWFSSLIGPSAASPYSGSMNFYGGSSPTMNRGRLSSAEANAGGGFGY
jgi:hypothetical protein